VINPKNPRARRDLKKIHQGNDILKLNISGLQIALRQGQFFHQIFERYQRSEKALVSALVEMYIQGRA
jgi:transposase-like protein